jgi:DNA-binding NarL/FixJ family response regulator
MFVEGLRTLLSPDCEIVGTVEDGRELLAVAEAQRPDLIITDISMPGIDGIEATRRLRRLVPAARVLVLSIHDQPSWVHAAFAAGARGYLTKTSALIEVETAVREVLKGNFYISAAVSYTFLGKVKRGKGERIKPPPPEISDTLSPREMEIVQLVGKGLGNREIAEELGLSVATIRTHLTNLYEKIGVVSRVELALYAAQSEKM